jgi:hypothetical protein
MTRAKARPRLSPRSVKAAQLKRPTLAGRELRASFREQLASINQKALSSLEGL